ncbi:DUF3987 domain-containing protein [Polymorphobacter arshaanensis]|nr:DUF3987 domain-containing protein [Polymorphobacter arshaanensis]
MQDAIKGVAAATGAPPEAIIGTLLAEASWAVQSHYDVQLVFNDWKLSAPSSLFTLTISESGGRKSVILANLSEGRNRYEEEASRDYYKRLIRYKGDMEIFNAQRQEIIRKNKASMVKNDDLYNHDLTEPKRPPNPKSNQSNFTTAGLMTEMAFCRPSIGVMTAEAGIILKGYSAGAGNGGEFEFATTMSLLWDKGEADKNTKESGKISYSGRRLTVGFMCQSVAARAFLASDIMQQQGMQARFLINQVGVVESPECLLDGDPMAEANASKVKAFNDRLYELHRESPKCDIDDEFILAPKLLQWENQDSSNPLGIWYNHVGRQVERGDHHGSNTFFARVTEHACRIAGVLAAFEGYTKITNKHAEAAVAIIEYFIAERRSLDVGEETSTLNNLKEATEYVRGWFQKQKTKGVTTMTKKFFLDNARGGGFKHMNATVKANILEGLVFEEVIKMEIAAAGMTKVTNIQYLL